ncbi:hypothetical protein [Sediminibacterium sp.]|uniref:hypothetical protein n=1 Tax=Sediminibacterium sp. TaxID=1917865 RepID=UPI003F6EF7FD
MLKKGFTILSLCLLLFSWGGYNLLLSYLETKSDQDFQTSLFQDEYDEASLIHLKIAASTPYGPNSATFESATGDIDINGVTYHFVKRRFFKDSLELLCVPNIDKISIRNARDQFLSLAANFNSSSNNDQSSNQQPIHKFSLSDFTGDHCFTWQFRDGDIPKAFQLSNPMFALADYTSFLERPPQA